MSRRYYLSLGSNIQPEKNLGAAVVMLASYSRIVAVSRVYETQPLGAGSPQGNYLNAALLVESELEPLTFLKEVIGEIETTLGRERTGDKFAARTIDIDVMVIDPPVSHIEHRPIPSPELMERAFVAVPLAEIDPGYVHPQTGQTLAEIAAGFAVREDEMVLREDVVLNR